MLDIKKTINDSLNLDTFNKVYERIKPHIKKTECKKSDLLSNETDAEIFLKLENDQVSGSFKIRGVTNKILSLSESEKEKLLIAASTGNHGAAFAHTVNKFNLSGKLFVPEHITKVKLEALKIIGIPLTFIGNDCVETEAVAGNYCSNSNSIFVGPYNDLDVIAGQGTIGIELMEQMSDLDYVFVPIGGGGLISGIAAYLKQASPKTKIIGCLPESSPVMYKSVQAGRIITMDSKPTLSDATAGGINPNSITFDICCEYVDDYIIITEKEIISALKHLHYNENVKAEGASAMTVASALKMKDQIKGKRIALIISGGKIDPEIIKQLGDSDE